MSRGQVVRSDDKRLRRLPPEEKRRRDAESRKRYVERHPERFKKSQADYRSTHRAEIAERKRKRNQTPEAREKARLATQRYRKANPQRIRNRDNEKRARRTPEQIARDRDYMKARYERVKNDPAFIVENRRKAKAYRMRDPKRAGRSKRKGFCKDWPAFLERERRKHDKRFPWRPLIRQVREVDAVVEQMVNNLERMGVECLIKRVRARQAARQWRSKRADS